MAHEMVKRNETHLVKVIVPHIAAMSATWLDYNEDSPELNYI